MELSVSFSESDVEPVLDCSSPLSIVAPRVNQPTRQSEKDKIFPVTRQFSMYLSAILWEKNVIISILLAFPLFPLLLLFVFSGTVRLTTCMIIGAFKP